MLPFLKPKRAVSTIIERRRADGVIKSVEDEGMEAGADVKAAEALMQALANKDAAAVVAAFKMLKGENNEES